MCQLPNFPFVMAIWHSQYIKDEFKSYLTKFIIRVAIILNSSSADRFLTIFPSPLFHYERCPASLTNSRKFVLIKLSFN